MREYWVIVAWLSSQQFPGKLARSGVLGEGLEEERVHGALGIGTFGEEIAQYTTGMFYV